VEKRAREFTENYARDEKSSFRGREMGTEENEKKPGAPTKKITFGRGKEKNYI